MVSGKGIYLNGEDRMDRTELFQGESEKKYEKSDLVFARTVSVSKFLQKKKARR